MRDISSFSGWYLLSEAERLVENQSETMDPLTGLGLTHAEDEGLDGLKRVDFEIEQNEQQRVGVG